VVPPKLTAVQPTLRLTLDIGYSRFEYRLSSIDFPHNAGIAFRTTKHDTWNLTRSSHGRLERELQLVLDGRNFTVYLARLWRLPPAYFPLSQPFLNGSPVALNYPQKWQTVKCGMNFAESSNIQSVPFLHELIEELHH
jgi:hypothetical protein